jgi:hypothetical protein
MNQALYAHMNNKRKMKKKNKKNKKFRAKNNKVYDGFTRISGGWESFSTSQ